VGTGDKKLKSNVAKMDIGVLGGTFDPIHLGHLAIAEEARQRLDLRRVIFIPAGQPWLKVSRMITSAEHRKKMIELAISKRPFFELSTVEVERRGPSYTVDTLHDLQKKLDGKAKFFLILGWDSLNELPRWHNPVELLKLCRLVAFTRSGSNPPDLEALEASAPEIKQSTLLLDIEPIDISSTDIRTRVAEGLPISGLVPHEVEVYIREHNLYR
jgi:nicotinate-nucleotide adenylyltransferase